VAGQDAAAGTPFGRYRLLELLGRGGMGEVWRAYDTAANNRTVAIKLLPPHLAGDSTFVERFRREADAAACLNNPHIVPIHNYGEIDGRLYVDMRLVEGRNLQEVLAEGPLEPERAVRIVEQVARALHAAHRIGLVHRDVKPSNILLDDDDFAYLIDFGIARAAGETGLTSTGSTVGTWAYMAPERFKTGAADARSDVYSLTCVLYQCLTGQLPFPADDREQVAFAHMSQPPPKPSAFQSRVSAQMDRVIATGMAKNPDERFATTKQLAEAARAALSTTATGAVADETMGTALADTVVAGTTPAEPTGASAGSGSRPPETRRFSQRWPNPEGTGHTPYRDHVEPRETPRPKKVFGPGQVALAVGGAAMLTAALVTALWLIFRNTESPADRSGSPNVASAQLTTPAESTTTTTVHPAINNLPGTDSLGFVDYPGARCDPGNPPAVMARTTLSVLVVCQLSPGNYYYRAVRMSDHASIELANAVRTSAGFDVTNPADGSLRQVRPTYVKIVFPGVEVQTEPIVGYVSR
jgi:serine/threonine protein kinase